MVQRRMSLKAGLTQHDNVSLQTEVLLLSFSYALLGHVIRMLISQWAFPPPVRRVLGGERWTPGQHLKTMTCEDGVHA